jgi:hypothetical protein
VIQLFHQSTLLEDKLNHGLEIPSMRGQIDPMLLDVLATDQDSAGVIHRHTQTVEVPTTKLGVLRKPGADPMEDRADEWRFFEGFRNIELDLQRAQHQASLV